ncbi:hypothetical protein AAC387_Pa11g0836 [Persea americana]
MVWCEGDEITRGQAESHPSVAQGDLDREAVTKICGRDSRGRGVCGVVERRREATFGGLNLEDLLHVDDSLDLYVSGFQEIVPLNAGNVPVIEDNEPAAKWLSLVNRALNKQRITYSRPLLVF